MEQYTPPTPSTLHVYPQPPFSPSRSPSISHAQTHVDSFTNPITQINKLILAYPVMTGPLKDLSKTVNAKFIYHSELADNQEKKFIIKQLEISSLNEKLQCQELKLDHSETIAKDLKERIKKLLGQREEECAVKIRFEKENQVGNTCSSA